jgi:hypothetical protein
MSFRFDKQVTKTPPVNMIQTKKGVILIVKRTDPGKST